MRLRCFKTHPGGSAAHFDVPWCVYACYLSRGRPAQALGPLPMYSKHMLAVKSANTGRRYEIAWNTVFCSGGRPTDAQQLHRAKTEAELHTHAV